MKRNDQNRHNLLALLGCLWLAGCTAGLVEETVPEAARPIELRFERLLLGASPGTRAEPSESTPLPEGATVRIAAYRLGEVGAATDPADFATTKPFADATYVVGKEGALSPCRVDAEGKKTNEAGAEPLAVRGGVYDFYAVSPARSLAQVAANENKWQISGIPHKEDVMTSQVRTATITQASPQVSLESFQRQCAQVVFTVSPATGADVIAMDSLKGIGLQLTAFSTSGASLVAGGAIPATGGDQEASGTVLFAADEFVPVAAGSDLEKLGLNKVTGEVLPKDDTPFEVAVTVKRNKDEVTLRAAVGDGEAHKIRFEAGKRYIFTLVVKNDQSQLLLNVVAWNPVSFTDTNVGGPDGTLPVDPEINPGTTLGFVVARWTHINWEDTVGESS